MGATGAVDAEGVGKTEGMAESGGSGGSDGNAADGPALNCCTSECVGGGAGRSNQAINRELLIQ